MPNSNFHIIKELLSFPPIDGSSFSACLSPFAYTALWVFGCPSPPTESHGGFAGGLQFGSSQLVRFPYNPKFINLKSFHARQLLGSVSSLRATILSILMRISGITTDLLVYSIIIPVLPFQLERLSYHKVSSLTGWLLCAYVSSITILINPLTHIF